MAQDVLHYSLSVSNWRAHEFTVVLSVPAHKEKTLTLTLPSWIPGSYMVRDFARNIVTLTAESTLSGTLLSVSKHDKQTWLIDTQGEACEVKYVVYANDLSIRSAYINDQYAFINGTSAFLTVSGFADAICQLTISLPEHDQHLTNWDVHTSMPKAKALSQGNTWGFEVESYEEFIDHPIYIGVADTHEFTVDGVTFTLLFSGNNKIDYARIARDLTPICRHHLALFGDPQPIQSYLFMTLLADTGFGGLEHKYSTALLYPRFDLPMVGDSEKKSDSYITFLSLCSHEFFHTWHVKRIKPDVMVNPDLSKENYTNQLWIYEGFTSYYDDVALARTGVIEPQKYLDIVGQNISRLLQNAGRFKQSAAESSFDAWTKFYKQDASATNNIVSYYNKGGIIALGLDLLLRNKSDGNITLDTLMKLLWDKYGKDESGTPDNVIETLCLTHFKIDVKPYLDAVVYGKEDVNVAELIATIGLAYGTRARTSSEDKGGLSTAPTIKHQFGAILKPAPLGLSVTQVYAGLAAMKAGVQLNDIIIAVDGHVVNPAKLQRMLDNAQTDSVTLTVIRDGRLLSLDLPVIAARKDMAFFEIKDSAVFTQWLDTKR
ncbi:PDZ domain-containing protein [Alteromonas sp. D210916BOD_24]|uniref:M61 family metallopeptidase n=1 Tax=Alteromonas sp. D210916BOD_24 TaxID=3157618 RepID=UPI00399D4E9A